MALPTNTFATYEAIGNREDLSDVIYRIDPTETPFMSGIEKEKASAVNHEWQTQALAAVNTANAQLEGDDAVADSTTATVRLGNICQISRKTPRVTGTQRAVEHAGRDDEMAYQEMLKGLELKRDMEAILVGTNQAKTSGTDGTQRLFTESNLKSVLQSVWNSGGKPDVIMTGGFNKQVFSTFTGRATPTEDTKAKKIVAAVDAYESDFGTLRIAPNRFMRPRDVLALQMDMWAVAYLNGRRFVSFPLAKTGDSDWKEILSEYTLVARNEKASGGVFENTTS